MHILQRFNKSDTDMNLICSQWMWECFFYFTAKMPVLPLNSLLIFSFYTCGCASCFDIMCCVHISMCMVFFFSVTKQPSNEEMCRDLFHLAMSAIFILDTNTEFLLLVMMHGRQSRGNSLSSPNRTSFFSPVLLSSLLPVLQTAFVICLLKSIANAIVETWPIA